MSKWARMLWHTMGYD